MFKFSIITPVFNSEKYLSQCIKSVLRQDFCDFEFILVDDGSNDSSLEIIKKHASDTRIKYFSKVNQGQGVARNLALQKAKGKYILYLDADDWLEKGALRKLDEKFKKDDCDIIFFNVFEFHQDTLLKNEFRYIDTYSKFKDAPFSPFEARQILFNSNALPFKAYKREFLVENKIKYSATRFIEDSEFYFKAMLCANKVSCLDEYILNYRIHQSSTTFKGANRIATIEKTFLLCEKILDESKYNDCKEIRQDFLRNRLRQIFYYYYLAKKKYRKQYFYMIKKILKYIKEKYGFEFIEKASQNKCYHDVLKYPFQVFCFKRALLSSFLFLKSYIEI